MFGLLKKHLKKSVSKFTEKVKKDKSASVEPKKLKKPAKLGLKERIVKRVTETKFSEKDIDDFFEDMELNLLQANVALEVVDFLKAGLKARLAGKEIKRRAVDEFIKTAFEESLLEIIGSHDIDLDKIIKEKKPACFVFLGFNGSGKTTSIAKLANYLIGKKYKPILAAGDTFRAAAIDQLEHHGDKLGIKTVKQNYGADSAAVVFDAVKHAQTKRLDVVLADTAGRSHTNTNLMDELVKVCRVNKPDLKILVVDSLTGNDAVEQAKRFDKSVGVDAVVLTKTDVNEKGGSILSVCYAIKKPILFLGTGQGYNDFIKFEAKKFVKELL